MLGRGTSLHSVLTCTISHHFFIFAGVVTVNSVDFVVFSESDLSVVVHTLIAGSVLTNPKQRQGGVVDKSQLKQKTLPRQRSTWQHRLFDLTPLAFEEIVANVPTEVNTTEHACVGVSMFMDLELTQRWSELTKNPQVADDLNDCYAQLTAYVGRMAGCRLIITCLDFLFTLLVCHHSNVDKHQKRRHGASASTPASLRERRRTCRMMIVLREWWFRCVYGSTPLSARPRFNHSGPYFGQAFAQLTYIVE